MIVAPPDRRGDIRRIEASAQVQARADMGEAYLHDVVEVVEGSLRSARGGTGQPLWDLGFPDIQYGTAGHCPNA
ncbi:hypothetical protein RA280_30825 [Cupriavidus sp. CV2]|uniref:hypothetical protein n=1 Tax=Cupriavidus ulmosensis TaxID=3065913 RepID=UPI00296AF533|nr:hypothetical protein [Cupriavidus sp. CV2]MDW3686059.1 hypothetical protein [Cupriavidus sp. CV2]